ncbi:MAG: D-tyrosyl-tRNA(Tyr) deacylase [Actinomycetia bacterium]|nr:D-tyrosyl-tRNA(Tyr) deacylase [Actinomycetes bacterium]
MKAVVQRCSAAQVRVGQELVARIDGPCLLALVGVAKTDTLAESHWLAQKILGLRVFDASNLPAKCLPPGSAREVSVSDTGLPVLLISQFTLYGKTAKGRRPTWEDAAAASVARPLFDAVAQRLAELGAQVSTGQFGADMAVTSTNDGPLTLILESASPEPRPE